MLVGRIHHCYADGMALVQVMLSLTDTAPEPERQADLTKTWLDRDGTNVWQRMLEPAQAISRASWRMRCSCLTIRRRC